MKHRTKIALLSSLILLNLTAVNLRAEAPLQGSISLKKTSPETSFPGRAKISLLQALEIGLKKIPGKPLKVELKEDEGFLIFEVEILAADQKIHEITVDAGTGKILEIELDSDEETGAHGTKKGLIETYTKSQHRL